MFEDKTLTCKECGETHIALNSCRNRHCPNCQSYAREKWIQNENNYLLKIYKGFIVDSIINKDIDIIKAIKNIKNIIRVVNFLFFSFSFFVLIT